MTILTTKSEEFAALVAKRAAELFDEQEQSIVTHTDRVFVRLMVIQWLFGIVLAIWVSPRTWLGTESHIHLHVWVAIFLGGIITSVPILFGLTQSGKVLTRHVIAIGQMLMSALLIHLSGGRIETHFHIFGSLAILAFYRDWKVLISASVVVAVDHLVRGIFWPQSVYGVVSASVFRSFEHSGWVVYEVVFLIISIRKSRSEMWLVADRQARLEFSKEEIEHTVAQRTADLIQENLERRQAEEQLRKSQSQLAQAQQIAHLGGWEWDLIENRVTWSEETRRLYGRKPEDNGDTMERCVQHVHPGDRERVGKIMAEAIEKRQSFTCVHRAILPDGSERIMQGRGEVLTNEQGQPVKLYGVVQDITELKRAEQALSRSEEQLRQSQKMEAVGRLAGGVAHDFNNLLTVIGGYCEVTLEDMAEEDPLRRNIIEIQTASERASALTGQLLAFSRKQMLAPRVFQLNDVVQGTEKMLRRLIGEDIDLAITYDPALGHVTADPGQIEQVIMNLVVNARDAMPRGGKLTISTENVTIDQATSLYKRTLDAGDYVMLAIGDNGVGMTEEVKSHLFEPFFTTKGLGKGTGLGLATCYGIVSQSGGHIRVYSEPNQGTVFKIYLPRTDAKPAIRKKIVPEALPGGTESVLVVEDDSAVRKLAVTVLRGRGYMVQECNNAFEALELIGKRIPFDLVLTDVIMPRMSGKELSEQVKLQCPDTKVLLMSGYTGDTLAHHKVLDEGLYFLEKPFSPARLARKVREVIDARQPDAQTKEVYSISH